MQSKVVAFSWKDEGGLLGNMKWVWRKGTEMGLWTEVRGKQ
jgi:hypothetical protein